MSQIDKIKKELDSNSAPWARTANRFIDETQGRKILDFVRNKDAQEEVKKDANA